MKDEVGDSKLKFVSLSCMNESQSYRLEFWTQFNDILEQRGKRTLQHLQKFPLFQTRI